MDEDWYERGVRVLKEHIATIAADYPPDIAADEIYALLNQKGLLDYDIEKDVYYEWAHGEEE